MQKYWVISEEEKTTDTFDNDINGKLDFFHAVKRVTTALSKKRPLFYPAIQDFWLVLQALLVNLFVVNIRNYI